jgi:predicted nuclease with TOPRIM domain
VPKYLKPDEIAKLRTKGSYREQDLRLPGNSTLKTLHDSIQEMFKDPEKTVRMRDHYRMYDPTKKSLKDVPLEKMISEVLVNYGSKYSVNILLEPTSKQKTEEETTARILELLRNAKEGGANVGKIIKKISKTAAHDFTD